MKRLTALAARLQRDWWHPQPTPYTAALLPLAGVYAALAWLNRLPWQMGWRQAYHPGVPVIVVGNLIVGGAGKTPTTMALVAWLRQQGWQPGIVSRGYGRTSAALCVVNRNTAAPQCGDEPLLMHLRTGAPVVVHADRAKATRALLQAHPEVDLIVSDDGLQHHRLARDAALIVFDARGAGNGQLLPAGPLRQRLPAQLPESHWVVYNAPLPSTPLPGHCAQRTLAGAVALNDWWQGAPARLDALNRLAQQSQHTPVWAAAGIAEPERFFNMLEQQGIQLHRCPLPDHADLATLPWPATAGQVLITEKDAVKLPPAPPGGPGIWVVALDFQLPDTLTDVLSKALASTQPGRHRH
jgi:tetraacyldisaccharide 4'-kinase